MACLTRQHFGKGNAFVFGLVRQHRPHDHVADGIDAIHVGAVVTVGLDPAALVECDTGFFQAEAFGVGLASDGDQHDVGLDGFRVATGSRFDRHGQAFALLGNAGHFRGQLEFHALFFQHALELLGDVAVHRSENLVHELDHGDLGAEAVPDRSQLEADHPAADDDQLARNLVKLQRTGGGDHLLFVDLHTRQGHDVGAGGDDDILCLNLRDLAVLGGHLDLACGQDLAGAVEGIDLVLLDQEADPADVGVDHILLVFHHDRQVELRLVDLDAEHVEAVTGLLEHFRGMQQRLGRNAADVETGAAVGGALFDNSYLQTELGRLDRTDIPPRAGSDDDEIVLGHFGCLCLCSWFVFRSDQGRMARPPETSRIAPVV